MAVVCITRELASKGEETARELTKTGGYRYIERDYIETRLAEHKIGPDVLQQYDEKKPGLWASMSENRDRYLHFLKSIIYDEAAKGGCIILGRGAGALLQGIPGVLSIRLVSPYSVRIDRVKIAYACDDRTAEHHIKQSDHERQGFHRYFFDTDWRDSSLYDLTINIGRISPESAAEIIEKYRKTAITAADEKAGNAQLNDLRLRTAVTGAIIFTKRIQIQSLTVVPKDGQVTLIGFAVSRIAANAAVEAARSVQGVGNVVDELQIMPPVVGS